MTGDFMIGVGLKKKDLFQGHEFGVCQQYRGKLLAAEIDFTGVSISGLSVSILGEVVPADPY
jgi:hypothetical protein